MKKNPLLIALAALAALGLLYAGLAALKRSNETGRADAEALRLSVLSLEGADSISFNYGAGELGFDYTEQSGWNCAQHPSWPIEQNALETLEYDLANLKAVRILETHGALSEYGLDAPEYTVNVTDLSGGAHTLTIGGEDVNGNRYAALAGDGRVFVISPTLTDALGRDILSYVDYRQLPHPAEDDVTALTLEQGGDVWRYDRVEADGGARHEWRCLKNGEAVEPLFENVETAIYDLVQLSFSSCAAYEPSDELKETMGLAEPRAVITVGYQEGGESKSYTLSVGGAVNAENAQNVYVMLEGSEAVTVCANEGLSEAISLLRSV